MKKKVMVVEDDDFFRSAVKSILGKKYEVIEASNGRMAREIIVMTDPDVIISDIQMPYLSGVELLEWVRENRKAIPVILMTGFSQILETTEAHELGAADFLTKPFKEQDVLDKLRAILKEEEESVSPPVPPAGPEKDFCKIPIEDFLTEKDTDYGIYIKVADGKFIKIAHKGGKIPESKIMAFKEKGVNFLYVQKEDFLRLVGFTLGFSKAVNASGNIDPAKKLRFLQYTGSLIVQQAFVAGTNEVLFNHAKDFVASSMNILSESEESLDMLEQLNGHTDFLYAHSLGVSIYAVMIAKQIGLQSPQTHFKLAFAGLFHDIGLKEIPKEVLEKSRARLSQKERSLIETHSSRGREILESMRGIPSDVLQIVYEHHEDLLGTGYPQRLDKNRIHPLSLIVAVADAFCNLTIQNPNIERPLGAAEAFARLKQTKYSQLDSTCLEALGKLVRKAA